MDALRAERQFAKIALLLVVGVLVYVFCIARFTGDGERIGISLQAEMHTDGKIINSASVTWASFGETYVFPCNIMAVPPWCPYWLGDKALSVMSSKDVPTLKSETYSLALDGAHLEHILLNWNESYPVSLMKIEIDNVSLPEASTCVGNQDTDEFAWRGNNLLLSEKFMSEVQKNASRGANTANEYTNLVLLGTSETRALFAKLCQIHGHPVLVNKTTARENCGNVTFYNMCTYYHCGCDFKGALENALVVNGSTIVSASCGLHGEYLLSEDRWRSLFENLAGWSANYSAQTGNLFQFRTSNAINPAKTRPSHLVLARNNVRSKFWAHLALEAFSQRNIAIFDVYRFTEPIFWRSSDHVHFHANGGEIYSSLARIFAKVTPLR